MNTLLCTALSAATVAASLSGAPPQTPLTALRIAEGLDQPLWVGSPPADEDRLFVAERTGRIWIVANGAVLPAPFLDLSARITTVRIEQGLLSVAFHPEYAARGTFYVYYTQASDGAIVVERYTVSPTDPNLADPQSGVIILGPVQKPSPLHNGGGLAFGPNDGYLYVSLGDGMIDDPGCLAQSGASLLGKILRIDVDGGFPYAIPPGNPFVIDPNFADEIWTYGWRNPWRFSFDRATGDMYVGDVGNVEREEISFQSATSTGGENFGWKIMEGTTCFSPAGCATTTPACGSPAFVSPIHEYSTTFPFLGRAVIAGHVYRGCGIPDLIGTYVFGDFYRPSRIWTFRYDGLTLSDFQERTAELTARGEVIGNLTSFGEDARGEIYFTDLDGVLFQLAPDVPPAATNLGFGKLRRTGETTLFELCGLLAPGQQATFILRRAYANRGAALLLSDVQNPTPLSIGTLVPLPVLAVLPSMTGPSGRLQFTVSGLFGPATVYAQWVTLDPESFGDIGISNALEIRFP